MVTTTAEGLGGSGAGGATAGAGVERLQARRAERSTDIPGVYSDQPLTVTVIGPQKAY
jgi:hypothetical protein